MAHKNHDQVFFINFGMVLAALFGIFFVCIIAARLLDAQGRLDARRNQGRGARASYRRPCRDISLQATFVIGLGVAIRPFRRWHETLMRGWLGW